MKDLIGKTLKYNLKDNVKVIGEDETHVLIQFSSGFKLTVSKNCFQDCKTIGEI